MKYEFQNRLIRKQFLAANKGSCKNIYGGILAKILLYFPIILGIITIFQTGFIAKFLMQNGIVSYNTIKTFFPILLVCLFIGFLFSWIKVYVPYISEVIAKRTGLPWKDFDTTVKIGDEGVTIIFPDIETKLSWRAIDRVIDRHGFVYFYYGQFANMIPWKTIGNDVQKQEFLEYCQSRIEQAKLN